MKKYYRNYLNDNITMYLDIYKSLDKCFKEHQTDTSGVDYSTLVSAIMKDTKGRYNQMVINEILKEFEI